MTNLLIASNVILWIAVIVLATMVFALVRQIGVLYERVAPAGALSGQTFVIDKAYVDSHLETLVDNEDLSRFIL